MGTFRRALSISGSFVCPRSLLTRACRYKSEPPMSDSPNSWPRGNVRPETSPHPDSAEPTPSSNQPANARREYGFHRMAHWQQRFHGAQGFCEYTYPRQTPDAVQHREVLNPLSPVQHRLVLTILGEAFRSAGKTSWSENRHSDHLRTTRTFSAGLPSHESIRTIESMPQVPATA